MAHDTTFARTGAIIGPVYLGRSYGQSWRDQNRMNSTEGRKANREYHFAPSGMEHVKHQSRLLEFTSDDRCVGVMADTIPRRRLSLRH